MRPFRFSAKRLQVSRGISEPALPPEPESSADEGPSNEELMAYLDDIAEFIKEIDVRLATLERFVIKDFSAENIPAKKPGAKFFFNGK